MVSAASMPFELRQQLLCYATTPAVALSCIGTKVGDVFGMGHHIPTTCWLVWQIL